MNLLTLDFFERIKQQIKTELCNELFQRGKEQLFIEVPKAKTQPEQPKPKIIDEKEEKEEKNNKNINDNNNNIFEENIEKDKYKNLLGRKRERTPLFEIDNSIEVNYFGNEIIEEKEKEEKSIKEDKFIEPKTTKNKLLDESVIHLSDENSNNANNDDNLIINKNNINNKHDIGINTNEEEAKYDYNEYINNSNEYNKNNINNDENRSIIKLLEKCVFNFIYDKVISNSFSDNNILDKEIMDIIKIKGYSNVKSSLNIMKKNNFSKIDIKEKELDNYFNNNNISSEDEKNIEKDIIKNPQEYHYNIINDFYYRYKFLSVKKNIQKYICCVNECNGLAELNIEEKKFNVIQKHTISPKNHPNFNDDRPIKFMKKRKLEEIHIKKNDNNEKYHMEWFK